MSNFFRSFLTTKNLLVVAYSVLVGALWTYVGWVRHHALWTGMDLAIFAQAMWQFAHTGVPTTAILGTGFPLWGDHVHPMLMILTPIFWFTDNAVALLIAQGIAIAILTWQVVTEGMRHGRAGTVLGLLFPLGYGVAGIATFDFHEVALAGPVLAGGLIYFLHGKYRAATVLFVLFLFFKEDCAFIVAGLAAAMWIVKQRKLALILGITAIAWAIISVKFLIPLMSPEHRYLHASPVGGSSGPSSPLGNFWASMVHPGMFTITIIALLCAAGVVAVRSPLILGAIPPLLMRAISPRSSYWVLENHYNYLVTVVLVFASFHALGKFPKLWRWVGVALALVATVGSLTFHGQRMRVDLRAPAPREAAVRTAALIPAGARIAADVYLVSHLPASAKANLAVPPSFVTQIGKPIDVDWILLNRTTHVGAGQWVPAYMELLTSQGWSIVKEDDGIVLLKRG